MTILSPTDLINLGTQPHRVNWSLSIYNPATVFAAQVNNAAAAQGDTDIPYDNISSGGFAAINAGMTLYVGTTIGARDRGKIRVKAASSATVTVAENSIHWADNLYLTVVKFYEPWAVYPKITLDVNNIPTFYKDGNVVYTDQNSILDPVPMMGPHLAGFLPEGGGPTGFYFDGSASYDLNSGGAVNSWFWEFEGGTPATSSIATPGTVTWAIPGNYIVSLTVGSTLGRSFVGRRHVSIHAHPNNAASNFLPVNWGIDGGLSGDYLSGGWSGRFWMRQTAGATTVFDGAQIVIFAATWFGTTQANMGGNYLNLSTIVFVGYVRDGSVSIDPDTSVVSFDVTGLAAKLDSTVSFSVSVESKVSPTTWYEVKDLTVQRALYHYLRWHTNVYSIADVRRIGASEPGEMLPVHFADFDRSPIFSAISRFLESTLLGRIVVDRQGQMWMERKVDIIPVGSRTLGTVMSLTRKDWMNELQIAERRDPPVSYIELGGIDYDGPALDTFTALISSAPSHTPGYQGDTQMVNGMVLLDQDTTSQLVGNVFANVNKRFPQIGISFAGNYNVFDIAPQERLLIDLLTADSYLELGWVSKKFIPRAVRLNYDSAESILLVDITAEEETDGLAGVAGPYPPTPPADPPPVEDNPGPVDPPPGGGGGSGDPGDFIFSLEGGVGIWADAEIYGDYLYVVGRRLSGVSSIPRVEKRNKEDFSLIWSYEPSPVPTGTGYGGLVVDASGVYTSLSSGPSNTGFSTIKLDHNGSLVWNVSHGWYDKLDDDATFLYAKGTNPFFGSEKRVGRYAKSNGALSSSWGGSSASFIRTDVTYEGDPTYLYYVDTAGVRRHNLSDGLLATTVFFTGHAFSSVLGKVTESDVGSMYYIGEQGSLEKISLASLTSTWFSAQQGAGNVAGGIVLSPTIAYIGVSTRLIAYGRLDGTLWFNVAGDVGVSYRGLAHDPVTNTLYAVGGKNANTYIERRYG